MSVFETERPDVTSTSDYKLKVLRETTRARKNNLRSVEEGLFKKKDDKKTKEKLDAIDKKEEEKQKKLSLKDKLSKKATKESLNRSLFTLERDLVTENSDLVFSVALFNIIYEACWIDDAVKEATMYDMFDSVLETMSVLESCNIPKKPENGLLKNIKESALRVTKNAAKRITEAAKDNCDSEYESSEDVGKIDFSLSDEESMDLDSDINDLGKEEIVQLVKDKVLTVVQDEQRSSKEKSEAMDKINQDATPVDDDTEGESDAETAGSEVTPDNGAAEESVSVTEAKFMDMINRIKKEKVNRKYASSLFESIMINSYNNILTEADEIEKKAGQIEKDVDQAEKENDTRLDDAKQALSEATKNQILGAALQEAILTYTVLETLNTIGMYDFSPRTVNTLKAYYKNLR